AEPAEVSRPDFAGPRHVERQEVLGWQRVDPLGAAIVAARAATAHGVRGLNAAPCRTAVARDPETVGCRDVDGVAAHLDAVGCDVRPLGPELAERPVAPRGAAVRR